MRPHLWKLDPAARNEFRMGPHKDVYRCDRCGCRCVPNDRGGISRLSSFTLAGFVLLKEAFIPVDCDEAAAQEVLGT